MPVKPGAVNRTGRGSATPSTSISFTRNGRNWRAEPGWGDFNFNFVGASEIAAARLTVLLHLGHHGMQRQSIHAQAGWFELQNHISCRLIGLGIDDLAG